MPVRPPSGQSCSTCQYYLSPIGECRRSPPYVVLSQLVALANTVTKWPSTAATDWCGNWTGAGP